ncbi:uncharacterized protein [Panulirus ornatus]|uniref:uncharacterized protein isoform X2 n=1 Tax=Panulirus ornatus TaxID=150431 RepID=UPI003A87F57C
MKFAAPAVCCASALCCVKDYDKFSYDGRNRDSTKKLLLSPSPHSGERKGTNGTTAIFQPPSSDIYLCDKCENEFYSLREVQTHEKHCRGDMPSSPVIPSPEPELVDDEPEPAGQVPFLAYFNLQPAKHTGIEPYMSPRKRSASSPPRKLPGPIYPRYDSVAISSPLGKFLLANSKFRNKYQASQHFVMRYERHLHATPNTDINFSRERCNNRWIIVWRARKEEQPWVHLYCFTKAHRRDRLITIKTGLDRRSRRLLRMCHPLKVKLKRLQKRLVDRMLRLGGPTAPCIDLTEENQMDSRLASLGCPVLPANNSLPDSKTECWDNNLAEMCRKESSFNLKVSSSSKAVDDVSWMQGLKKVHGNSFVPGGSGILDSGGVFSNSLTPKHNAQLGISGLNPNASVHQSSLKLIPLLCHGSQQLSADPQLLLQTVGQKTQMAQFTSRNQLGQTLVLPVDGSGFPVKLKSSSSADISLIPLNSLPCKTSNSQVNSDILKPLSKKKYGICDPQSSVRGHKVNEQNSNDLEVGVPSGAVFGSSGYHQSQNKHFASSQSQSMLKVSQRMNSHVVPHMSENDSSVPLINANVTLSNITHTRTNSSIEIIDLSSDDDDMARDHGQSEADNAPQQLDGLACYPHTGAKVPDSSDYSLPKNGNSHWSSKQKSHCGAGRVGDLATNGQPPNVPPNAAASPVPRALFLPSYTVPLLDCHNPQAKGNSRKRKNEGPYYGGGKAIILDISGDGLKISNERDIMNTVSPSSKNCVFTKEDNLVTLIPKEIIPGTPEELRNGHPSPLPDVTFLKVSNQTDGSGNKTYTQENPRFIIDEDISFKSPFQIDENSIFSSPSVKHRQKVCESSEEHMNRLRVVDTHGKHISSNETPVGGFISNIVNTVNKDVDMLNFTILTGRNGRPKCTSASDLTLNENSLSKLHKGVSVLGKSQKEKNSAKQQTDGANKGRDRTECSEVHKLLMDECRELRQKGLGELRCLDLQDTRLTRSCVDRLVPSKTRRKSSSRLKYCGGLDSTAKLRIKTVNISEIGTTKSCNIDSTTGFRNGATNLHHASPSMVPNDCITGCIDENGNSASYLKMLTNRESLSSCQNGSGAKKASFGVISESNRKCSESRVSGNGKEFADVNFEKNQFRKQPPVSYSGKLFKNNEGVEEEGKGLTNEYSAHAECIGEVSAAEKKRLNISRRELLNLANDEWKEMFFRGFHPMKNVGPLLKKIEQLGYRMPKQGGSQICVNTVHDSCQGQEQKKSPKKYNKGKNFVNELKSLVQDECKEMSRKGFHPSKFALPEIKRAKCPVWSKAVVKVNVSSTTQLEARPECMGETAEECGALPAHIPSPEKPQNGKHSDELKVILKPDPGTSKMLMNSVKKYTEGSNLNAKNTKVKRKSDSAVQLESSVQLDSVVQPKTPSTKKSKVKNNALMRELNNLGKDEWKEIRGTGFHPSDIVGSDVKYLNSSSDEEDSPLNFSKSESPIQCRTAEKQRNSCTTEKEKKVSVKMNRELYLLLSDECKELKRTGKYVKKFNSHLRRPLHLKGLKTRVRHRSTTLLCRNYKRDRSALPTQLNNLSGRASKSGVMNVSTKKRACLQVRSTRSQYNVRSNIEVFTPRSSHRQILHTETAMCVLNYRVPNIN